MMWAREMSERVKEMMESPSVRLSESNEGILGMGSPGKQQHQDNNRQADRQTDGRTDSTKESPDTSEKRRKVWERNVQGGSGFDRCGAVQSRISEVLQVGGFPGQARPG